MKRKALPGAVAVVAVAALLMIGARRVWVKYSTAHLVVDGRVTTDFKLYFGPSGGLLLRLGAKQPRKVFVYGGDHTGGWADECPPSEFLFPPFVAIAKHWPPRCLPGGPYQALSSGNKLTIRASDGHIYEVTWQPPHR